MADSPPSDDQSKRPSLRLLLKDWGGLGISTLALAISFSSLYFSTLRVLDRASARVIAADFVSNAQGAPTEGSLTLALVNGGNRPAVLLRVAVRAGWSSGGRMPDQLSAMGANIALADLPLLLPPQDVKVLELPLPLAAFSRVQRSETATEQASPSAAYGVLEFTTLDSSGESHTVTTPVVLQVRLDRAGRVAGARAILGEQVPMVELLE